MENNQIRPVGHIRVNDSRGYGYLPKVVRKEVGLEGKGKIPFFLDANVVLLIRKGATREDVMKGLDILKEDLKLRWPENSEADHHDT